MLWGERHDTKWIQNGIHYKYNHDSNDELNYECISNVVYESNYGSHCKSKYESNHELIHAYSHHSNAIRS